MNFVMQRSPRTGQWIKGRSASGTCSNVTWDFLEQMLHECGRLKDDECIEKVEVSDYGVKYVIGKRDEEY